MKKLLNELRCKEEELLAKKMQLIDQIKEAEYNMGEAFSKIHPSQKDTKMRKSQNLK